MKHGVLLINLGTPAAASTRAIRSYLKQFLVDKRVIRLPSLIRYLLVYGLILPFRPQKVLHAYRAIWTPQGSPLLIHSQNLTTKLQAYLGEHYCVALGMRYGQPDIKTALNALEGCEQLTIIPLYPQYSSATTGSSLVAFWQSIQNQEIFPNITILRDFYQHPAFIHAQAEIIRPFLQEHDHLLLSYHGVPENHLLWGSCSKYCQSGCSPSSQNYQGCYRASCYQTSKLLSKALDLAQTNITTSFQSRLGKTPWITPFTDQILPCLAAQGIKRLAVSCPSFTTDCLETLEEIGIQAAQQWRALGGTKLTLIPCLNDTELWVSSLASIVQNPTPHQAPP